MNRIRGAGMVLMVALWAGPAASDLFVADFNGDGKPDVLMSSPSAPDGFLVLINQGEWDGKISFKKTWPDVKSAGASAAPSPAMTSTPLWTAASSAGSHSGAAAGAAAPSTPDWSVSPPPDWSAPPPAPAAGPSSWEPPAATASAPAASWPAAAQDQPAAPAKPMIQPPPAISSSTPRIKPVGAAPRVPPAPVRMTEKNRTAPDARADWKPAGSQAASQAKAMSTGTRRVAMFNYKDKTSGSQFAWLERGIANILKFDVMEVKSVQLIDREKTDVTFDPAWYRNSGMEADILITGEFEEVADRLMVRTWFLSPSMAATREFKVEGDRADIFSLIEKIGARLKQELASP